MPSPGRAARVISYAILIFWTAFTLFPLYWTTITSIKSSQTVNLPVPTFIPWVQFEPTLQPFRDIFGEGEGYGVSGMGNVSLFFRNSFSAAFFSSLIAVFLGAMAAYALSRFRYRRWKNNDNAFWFISQRMLPPIALVVPYFILFGRVGLLDKLPVLIAVYAAMNLPLVIWLLRDYFQDLPIEIEEGESMPDPRPTTLHDGLFKLLLEGCPIQKPCQFVMGCTISELLLSFSSCGDILKLHNQISRSPGLITYQRR